MSDDISSDPVEPLFEQALQAKLLLIGRESLLGSLVGALRAHLYIIGAASHIGTRCNTGA